MSRRYLLNVVHDYLVQGANDRAVVPQRCRRSRQPQEEGGGGAVSFRLCSLDTKMQVNNVVNYASGVSLITFDIDSRR